jgi:hypothetical protein
VSAFGDRIPPFIHQCVGCSFFIKAEHCPELVEMKNEQEEVLDEIHQLHRQVRSPGQS